MNIISIIRTVCALSVVTATSQLDVSQETVDDSSAATNQQLQDELIWMKREMRNMFKMLNNVKTELAETNKKLESAKKTVQIENRVLSLENEQSNMNSSISVIQEDQTEMTNGLEDLKNEMANSFDEVQRNITRFQKTQCCADVTKNLKDLKKRVDAIESNVIPTATPSAAPSATPSATPSTTPSTTPTATKYMLLSSNKEHCPANREVSLEECRSNEMLAFLRAIAPINSWFVGDDIRFDGSTSRSDTNPACSVGYDGRLFFNTNKSGRETTTSWRSICKTG